MKIFLYLPVSVQSLSHVWLFVTPWTAACQASLSITNSRSLLRLMSIKSVMTSNHLILCHHLLLLPSILPSIRVFSNESVLCIRWPKCWSFSFGISPPVGLYRSIAFCLRFMYYFIVWVHHYLYNHSLVRRLDYVQFGELAASFITVPSPILTISKPDKSRWFVQKILNCVSVVCLDQVLIPESFLRLMCGMPWWVGSGLCAILNLRWVIHVLWNVYNYDSFHIDQTFKLQYSD